MVNGLCFISAFLVLRPLKALYAICHIHSIHTQSYIDGKVQTAHQKQTLIIDTQSVQFMVQYHAQAHFDLQTGSILISERPTVPPELQPQLLQLTDKCSKLIWNGNTQVKYKYL